jgi:hypothetical protein
MPQASVGILPTLGVFALLRLLLAILLLLWGAKQVLGRGYPRAAFLLLVLGACFLEWAEPGHLTYGVPMTLPPTRTVATFSLNQPPLPAWADWWQRLTTPPAPPPRVTAPAEE